jgi:hypothetical protein
MGGIKGLGAFAKNGPDAMELYKMFIGRDIEITAEPNNVIDRFPSLADKTASQIRSGFNRVKDNAKEELSAINGKNILLFFYYENTSLIYFVYM